MSVSDKKSDNHNYGKPYGVLDAKGKQKIQWKTASRKGTSG